MDTNPPVIDEARLNALGARMSALWLQYSNDRKMIEERWLKNLRQVRKIHDPEILRMIPADRSKAYPGVTQWMTRGTIARLMQMLFPQTEKNYGVTASPLPDLSKEQLQQVLDGLVQLKSQGGDSAQVMLADEEIEKAIALFAKGKAERMELKISDDLQEMDFITLARKIVKSAVTYNVGVAEGPMHEKVPARAWQQNPNTGAWEAVEKEKFKPLFEFCPVWDYFPDLTAASIDRQDGEFRRHIMMRTEVEELASRQDFLGDRVWKYLRDHLSGNYQPLWWESVIKGENKSDQATVSDRNSRKYVVLSYWGTITGHELAATGVQVAESDLGKSFAANVWTIDSTTIKCRLAPLSGKTRRFHKFVFEDDDLSILGNGQCDVLRDSQLGIGECLRAALDNMSVVGPMVEIDEDRMVPGQSKVIRKHATFFTEGNGQASNTPAVRNINVESHMTECIALLNVLMSFAEKESGLPPPSLGDTSGGGSEALRTSKNASMFLGAAALPIRDTVRNYDSFTVSLVSALVDWNMRYDPNPSRDGDHDIIARGSTSLIAKEVLAGQLNEFRQSITEDELPYINTRGSLMARIKANDLPMDEILEDEDVAKQKIAAQQQVQADTLADQKKLVEAEVMELFTRALEHEAKAESEGVKAGASVLKTIVDAIQGGHKAAADHVKAAAAETSANRPAAGGAK